MSRKVSKKIPWIISGYEIFGLEGPKGLQIERLARQVKKSKSSFYHHFSDLEIFTNELLKYHLIRAQMIRAEEEKCKNIIPDLIELLVSNKTDLLFNRQLRINRNSLRFQKCYEEASKASTNTIVKIWSDYLGVDVNKKISHLVLSLAVENFYLHITEENLSYEWLEAYVKSLKDRIKYSMTS